MTSPISINELILRVLQGQATQSELDAVDIWRRRSSENERLYQQTADLWETSAGYLALPSRPVPRARWLLGRARKNEVQSFRFWNLRIAASALLVTGALAILISRPNLPNDATTATEFVTGANEQSTVHLDDGSVVRLGPGTVLRSLGERNVWLDGHAYFAVVSGAHPFVVRTETGTVRVLGTRFDLRSRDEGLRVVVVEGRVRLSTGDATVEVAGGEMSSAPAGDPPSVPVPADALALTDWTGDVLIFESTPLRQAAQEIGRRYGRRMVIRDSALADRVVTAVFSGRSADEVIQTVCRVTGARCSVQNDVVEIYR